MSQINSRCEKGVCFGYLSFSGQRQKTRDTLKVQKLNFRSKLVNLQEMVSNIYVVSWMTTGDCLDSAFTVRQEGIIYIVI